MRRSPVSPSEMARFGWRRVDPRPWRKLNARWHHWTGWRLEHCGHPTALHPWALYSPVGALVLTGVTRGNAAFGTAWGDLRRAAEWLEAHLAGRAETVR